MDIKTTSPHLSYYLERLNFDSSQTEELNFIFKFCLTHGGKEELDFTRPEGQSYNPRPARIALIGIKDAGITDFQNIKTLLLSSLLDQGSVTNALNIQLIQSNIPNCPTESLNEIRELLTANNLNKVETKEDLYKIFLCLFIDRIRHAHLSNTEVLKSLYFKAREINNNLNTNCINLKNILNHWVRRNESLN